MLYNSHPAPFVAYNLCNYKKILLFSPQEADTSVFVALWIHFISLKSFVQKNVAGNTGERCLLLPQSVENSSPLA